MPIETNSNFDKYGQFYDLLYTDKDYKAEALYIQNILERHGLVGGCLLEFGSGTGTHGQLISEAGYKVHGIEHSREMVSRVKTTPKFTVQHGDIALTSMGKKYDAVISLFHVMSYQISNSQLKAVFQNAAMHLEIGGLFVFDFWYSPAVYTQGATARIKRVHDDRFDVTRYAEPSILVNENRVDVRYTFFVRDNFGHFTEFEEIHAMRHFGLPEVDVIAESTGFERITAEEFLTSAYPSENTWSVCVVLRKVST